jgi:hypothetical protein
MATLAVCFVALPSSPIKLAFASIAVAAVVISMTQLDVFYDAQTGKLKDFGTAPEETVFPAWLAMASVGYLIYMLAAAIKLREC